MIEVVAVFNGLQALQWLGIIAVTLFLALVSYYIFIGIREESNNTRADIGSDRSGTKEKEAADVFESSSRLAIHYYKANQRFGVIIFALSVLTSVLGFVLILALVWNLVTPSSSRPTANSPAVWAAILGIVSQFIAATFLVIYRSVSDQATRFAASLADISVNQQAIWQGWSVFEKDEDLGLQTVASIAIALAQQRKLPQTDETSRR